MRTRTCAFLAALLAGSCSSSEPKATPRPTPPPSVTAEAGDLRTLPDVPAEAKAAIATELGALLRDVYERAFLPPLPPPRPSPGKGKAKGKGTPSPPPTPVPRPPPGDLFTDPARAALAASADSFAPGPGATVRTGTVRFTGVATLEADRATSALLAVEFTGAGKLDTGVPLRLKQTGQIHCVRTETGWRIAGFDVTINAERQVLAPSPSPSPA